MSFPDPARVTGLRAVRTPGGSSRVPSPAISAHAASSSIASSISLVPHLLTSRRSLALLVDAARRPSTDSAAAALTDLTRPSAQAAPVRREQKPSPARKPGARRNRLTRLTGIAGGRQGTSWLLIALVTVIFVAELFLRAVPAHAAESEPNEDLTPDLKALIAKERIRQRTGPRGAESRNPRVANDSQNCGSVDIGNSQEARGRSARERMNPRQQTVIVTGPVVNAARCR